MPMMRNLGIKRVPQAPLGFATEVAATRTHLLSQKPNLYPETCPRAWPSKPATASSLRLLWQISDCLVVGLVLALACQVVLVLQLVALVSAGRIECSRLPAGNRSGPTQRTAEQQDGSQAPQCRQKARMSP